MIQPPQPIVWISRHLKALADENRLRIVGLLARRPHFAEELAEFLELGAPTVSHHLRILRDADLVVAHRRGRNVLFVLQSDAYRDLLETLRPDEVLAQTLGLAGEEELAQQVLGKHLDQEGRIKALPTRLRARAVVLRWVAQHLQSDRLYPERELRLVLLKHFEDPDMLREALVAQGWLQQRGTVYRRVEEVDAL